MNDAPSVRVIEGGAGHRQQFVHKRDPARIVETRYLRIGKPRPLDQLHRDEGQAVLLVGIEDRDDPGMGQAARRLRLAEQAQAQAFQLIIVGVLAEFDGLDC